MVGSVAGVWSSVPAAKTAVDPDAPEPVDSTGGVAEIPVGIPKDLTATDDATLFIEVDWTAPLMETCACLVPTHWQAEYEYEFDGTRFAHDLIPASDGPGFLIMDPLAGTRHTIYVRGLNGSRASPWISVTTRTAGPRVADGPGVGYPLALTATSSDTAVGDVILNWTAPDEMDCNCAVPDSWQIEYEDDEGRRFAYVPGGVGQQLPPPRGQQAGGLLKSRSITTFDDPAVGGSVTINSLTAGRIYTFYVRGLSGPFAGEWVGVSHNVGSRFGGDFDPPRNVRAIWEHDPNYPGQYRVVITWDDPDHPANRDRHLPFGELRERPGFPQFYPVDSICWRKT